MVHRAAAGAVKGLVDALTIERKRVPGEVLFEAADVRRGQGVR